VDGDHRMRGALAGADSLQSIRDEVPVEDGEHGPAQADR
jgi:hypothetical protein